MDKDSSTSGFNDVDLDSLSEQARERYHQDTKQRKFLAYWVVWATSIWLGVVLVIVVLQGCNVLSLATSVMTALLVTTTFNVLGLAYIVLEGLFGHSKHAKH
jgi:hypothetical protein